MGIFDRLTKLAEKAANAVVETSDKINQTYQKEGFDGLVNKTADKFTEAGQKTQDYITNLSEKNKQIRESIPENDLEATLAKATAVVINTTQTLVKDAVKVTKDTVDSVSKNIEKTIVEQEVKEGSPVNATNSSATKENTVSTENTTTEKQTVTKKTAPVNKELFLNEGQIAELNCMPITLFVKHLGAESNIDGMENKYKIGQFTFITDGQKWFDFNEQKGGSGSLSFISHYIRVTNELLHNENADVKKEIRNSTFDVLSKILEMKEYQDDLTVWIKKENAKNKNVAPNTKAVDTEVNPYHNDDEGNDEGYTPPAKPKRVRKPAVKVTPTEKAPVVEEVAAPVRSGVKKGPRKIVGAEPAVKTVEKAVAKKTSKKVVKEAVEETFSAPEVKSPRKPKA